MGMNVCYKCGDMGHGQRNCLVATRLGRLMKLKEVRIEEWLSLDCVMVPNDKVSKSSQVHDGTSSGKCKFYFMVEVGKLGLFWYVIIDLLTMVVE